MIKNIILIIGIIISSSVEGMEPEELFQKRVDEEQKKKTKNSPRPELNKRLAVSEETIQAHDKKRGLTEASLLFVHQKRNSQNILPEGLSKRNSYYQEYSQLVELINEIPDDTKRENFVKTIINNKQEEEFVAKMINIINENVVDCEIKYVSHTVDYESGCTITVRAIHSKQLKKIFLTLNELYKQEQEKVSLENKPKKGSFLNIFSWSFSEKKSEKVPESVFKEKEFKKFDTCQDNILFELATKGCYFDGRTHYTLDEIFKFSKEISPYSESSQNLFGE
ncbi:MAG: hypothetical protein AB7R69_04190 [Candidatus Babeliales bacterium]